MTQFACKICQKKFFNPTFLEKHVEWRHSTIKQPSTPQNDNEIDSIVCTICQKKFSNPTFLEKHVEWRHPTIRQPSISQNNNEKDSNSIRNFSYFENNNDNFEPFEFVSINENDMQKNDEELEINFDESHNQDEVQPVVKSENYTADSISNKRDTGLIDEDTKIKIIGE